uniref:Uncharacterized protein n=1 Tax=Rhizophora mucronata TaxID=61149 RepID=A0A2P2NAX4_RHIMU
MGKFLQGILYLPQTVPFSCQIFLFCLFIYLYDTEVH